MIKTPSGSLLCTVRSTSIALSACPFDGAAVDRDDVLEIYAAAVVAVNDVPSLHPIRRANDNGVTGIDCAVPFDDGCAGRDDGVFRCRFTVTVCHWHVGGQFVVGRTVVR